MKHVEMAAQPAQRTARAVGGAVRERRGSEHRTNRRRDQRTCDETGGDHGTLAELDSNHEANIHRCPLRMSGGSSTLGTLGVRDSPRTSPEIHHRLHLT